MKIEDFFKTTLVIVIAILVVGGLGYGLYEIFREKPLEVPPPFVKEREDTDLQLVEEEEDPLFKDAQIQADLGSPPLTNCTATPDTQEAEQMLSRVNTYRAQNGLGPLELSPTLMKAAAWFADDLLANNESGHIDSLGRDPSERAVDCGYPVQTVGENTAGGQFMDPLNWWQQSAEHNQVLLKPEWKVMGYGIADNGGAYRYVWIAGTQDDSGTQLPLPSPTETPIENECVRSGDPISVDSSMCSSGTCLPYTCTDGTQQYLCEGEEFKTCNPQPSPSPTQPVTPGVTNTPTPSPSTTPRTSVTPSPTQPQNPSPTQQAGANLNLSFSLPGIGASGNTSPVYQEKDFAVKVFDASNSLVEQNTISAEYTSGVYTGSLNIPSLPQGQYYVKAKGENTLQEDGSPEVITLTQQADIDISFDMVPGDLNRDNVLDIRDYNLFLTKFIACYLIPNCGEEELIDFDANGAIEIVDFNILLRSFTEVKGV